MVTLRSSDGEDFEVDEAVALQSPTIKRVMEENNGTDDNVIIIPLPNVKGKTLAKIIEYCKKRAERPTGDDYCKIEEELRTWNAEFVNVDCPTLVDIGKAAGYLEINSLSALLLQTGETMAVRKTVGVLGKIIDMFKKV